MGTNELKGKKVLIIDDDETICSMVQFMMRNAGAEVQTVRDSTKALREMYAFQPDLILLDIMMPHVDGWELCRQIRQLADVPIIMLSALQQPEDVVRGLETGADDYVTKPFRHDVLVARAAAVLRRHDMSDAADQPVAYSDGYLTIDLDRHQVLIEGRELHLSAKEYGMLSYLVQHAGRVRTFAQILDCVWGPGYSGSTEYLHVYVSRIRKKLEPDPRDPIYLISEHGIGYRFAPTAANHY